MEIARTSANQPLGELTKVDLAKKLGVSRASLYYTPKRPLLDLELKRQIEAVMIKHKSYGHKRIAIELKLNKKRILRVMKKFDLKPYRRRGRKPDKPEDTNKQTTKYQNLIKGFCPIRPNVVWVSDFTYIEFQGRFIYLATVMDLFTREIVGSCVSRFHNKELVISALLDAFRRTNSQPIYIHSDQGSEYESNSYIAILENRGINISMSKKSSPWENGFQESFYSGFKVDLGRTDQFEQLGELVEAIHLTVYGYNTDRIHTSLKMSPIQFKEQYVQYMEYISIDSDQMVCTKVSKEMGT